MLRELPRAGISIILHDLDRGARYLFTSNPQFVTVFASWLHVDHVWAVSSGRAALCLILQTLIQRSGRKEVVIPAYTCPTVALSVARAGLQVRLCDVESDSGNMDVGHLEEILTPNTLAIVPVHMHGIPCDMDAILAIARQHSVLVIEDCAQACGATIGVQKVGTFGDAAFFSLGRGKGFTAYAGGIGRISDCGLRIMGHGSQILGKGLFALRRGSWIVEAITVTKLLAMAVFFHPRIYWMIRSLPLGWNNEVYSKDFEISGMGRFRQGVALSLLQRLDKVIAQRRKKAEYLREQLREVPGVQCFEPPTGSQPSYPWLPLVVDERDKTVRRLRASRLGAAHLFTHSLNKYEYLRGIVPQGSYPAAEYIADHLLTLPTHEYVTRQDMDRMVAVLSKVTN